MRSKVIKLADINNCPVDKELFDVTVPAEVIDEIIMSKANEFGSVKTLDNVIDGSAAVCRNEKGRKMLIYPGLGIEAAMQAEKDVLGKKTGDAVLTVINGTEVKLTVSEILINEPSAIDDELAKKAGIEGVSTLDGLKEYIRAEQTEKKHGENIRQLLFAYNDYIIAESEFEIDEAEQKEWAEKTARSQYEENLAMGIDLRFTEEGDMISEEEAIASLAEGMAMQFMSVLVNRKFCEVYGYEPDMVQIESEAKMQAEMSGETDEDKIKEFVSMMTENYYYGFVCSKLEEKAREVLA